LKKKKKKFVTTINSKGICKETEVTVKISLRLSTVKRSKLHNVVVEKAASWSTVLPEQG